MKKIIISAIGVLVICAIVFFAVKYSGQGKGEESASNVADGFIGAGQTVVLDGVSITFLSVIEDSRCPAQALCRTQGRVGVVASVFAGPLKSDNLLIQQGRATIFGSHKISLVGVSPEKPASGKTIDKSEYRMAFDVK